jgi:haloacetate dehalogenase
MFEGFTETRVDVGDGIQLRVRHGGEGAPVVLLHGHPRTHTTWHWVAPLLVSAGYAVVCPDLRGYGQSSKPATTPDHAPYSKRTMAGDVLRLMQQLGHERFAVVGHDRGSYVAMRMALDAPHAVTKLAVLDSVPIAEALDRADARFATAWWHWFFFAQPDKPERAILADPDAWYGGDPARMGEENYADYRRAIHDPTTVHAMLEDYRAGLGPDRAADEADRAAGRRISCPTLVLWTSRDDLADLYGDVLGIWESWTTELSGGPIDSGHHVSEDAPEELARRLDDFLRDALIRDAVDAMYGDNGSADDDLAVMRQTFGSWAHRELDGESWADKIRSGHRVAGREPSQPIGAGDSSSEDTS